MSDEAERIVCTSCGAVNRIAAGRNAAEARCGKCRQPLFAGHPADVDTAMFERQVGSGTVPVLVDVWAPWCGPCRMMAPEYERAAAAIEPRARFLKLNSDNEQAVSAKLGIRGIPTMLLFSHGRELARISGAMRAGQIGDWVNQHLG